MLCHACKTSKHVSCFSAAELKQWIAGRTHINLWRCYDCQYPPCSVCHTRPMEAIKHNALVDGKYFCKACRFPPCRICGKERSENSMGGTNRQKQLGKPWTCPGCISLCKNCHEPIEQTTTRAKTSGYCSDACHWPPCAEPGCAARRRANEEYAYEHVPVWHCVKHRGNVCRKCNERLLHERQLSSYCSNACHWPPCAAPGCRAQRRMNAAQAYDRVPVWFCITHKRHA